jgi:hypothetical protein
MTAAGAVVGLAAELYAIVQTPAPSDFQRTRDSRKSSNCIY